MREVYYAYDHTEFFDREACLNYEKEAINLMKEIAEKYSFLDENMNSFIAPLDSVDMKEWIDWLNDSAAACIYIHRRDNLSVEADRFIFNNCDYYLNNGAFCYEEENIGLFRYDEMICEYVKVSE